MVDEEENLENLENLEEAKSHVKIIKEQKDINYGKIAMQTIYEE